MIYLLFVPLSLGYLVQGASTNSTSLSSPSPECTAHTRSVWSILGSCAVTLLICVWHALHPELPGQKEKYNAFLKQAFFALMAFLAPEAVVGTAGQEWWYAHEAVRMFRVKGYEWSMTHSYFGDMGGLVYQNEQGKLSVLTSYQFVEFCRDGRIANPLLTEKEIKALSKSDLLGKAIFGLQLFWFMLQVVVRASKGLAVTLVELDTMCMAILALVYLFFWWDKPLRPECPHVFYSTPVKKEYSPKELSEAWKAEPSYLQKSISYIRELRSVTHDDSTGSSQLEINLVPSDLESDWVPSRPSRLTDMIERVDRRLVLHGSLAFTWCLLGGLHLLAWDFGFPTMIEMIIWRVASLTLVACSLGYGAVQWFRDGLCCDFERLGWGLGLLGVIARALLVGLMLASLRALPSSAYETVPWTIYIPHL